MSLATRVQYAARVEATNKATTKRTPQDYCKLYRILDEQYRTTKESPLHHDNRCTIRGHRKELAS